MCYNESSEKNISSVVDPDSPVTRLIHWFNRPNILIVLVILLAAFLRFYRLDQLPPGFHFDLAFNAFDIARLMQGDLRIFFPANTGREPLYIYMQAGVAAFLGLTPFALRVTSAIVGLLTIPLIYVWARDLFISRAIGFLTALFATISFWHIFYSRDGLRVILAVPLTLLVFWFLWHAIQNLRPGEFALTGVTLSLALYTYPSARLLPIAVVLLVACAAWMDRSRTRAFIKGIFITAAVSILLSLPLGIYFWLHPDEFLSHTVQVSLLSPDANPDLPSALLTNLARVLGMFFVTGDQGLIRNLPGRPIFDPFLAVLFVIGLGVLVNALANPRSSEPKRMRAWFIAVWIGISLVTSLVSDDAPNLLRTLPALPAIMLLPAWGAVDVWNRLQQPMARRVVTLAIAGIISVSAVLAARDYFVVFAERPDHYYTYDVDKVEIADWLNRTAARDQVYLAPLFYQQGTIAFLTRNTILKSFDSRDTMILPDANGREDAYYAFPPEQENRIKMLATRLGTGERADVLGSNGAPILLVYHVPNANLPTAASLIDNSKEQDPFMRAEIAAQGTWNGEIKLLGARIDGAGAGERSLMVTLFMQALKPMSDELTFSVKALDATQRVWGQEDKMPGSNSYPTTRWEVNEIIVERFYPGLDPCAPEGEYHLKVQLYDSKTSQVLNLDDRNENGLDVGKITAGRSQGNRLGDLEPAQEIEAEISPGLVLFGYTLPQELKSGTNATLLLFLKGLGDGHNRQRVRVQYRDSNGSSSLLATQSILLPAADRGLCSLVAFRVPPAAAPGAAALLVNDTEIGHFDIVR